MNAMVGDQSLKDESVAVVVVVVMALQKSARVDERG